MPELDTRGRILFELLKKHGQTFTELETNAKTNHNTLARIIKILKKEEIIKNIDGKYHFSTTIKNPVLRSLKGVHTMVYHLDKFLDDLKNMENPFPEGTLKIHDILLLQVLLKLERYSSSRLTKREKIEFDFFDDIFNAITELIFTVLEKKNPRKTKPIKEFLIHKICLPILTEKEKTKKALKAKLTKKIFEQGLTIPSK